MFVVIGIAPDYQAEFFSYKEQDGFSSRYGVVANGSIFLTREAAEKWVSDNVDFMARSEIHLGIRELM